MLKTITKGKYRYVHLDIKGKDRLLDINYEKQMKFLWFWVTVGYVKEID